MYVPQECFRINHTASLVWGNAPRPLHSRGAQTMPITLHKSSPPYSIQHHYHLLDHSTHYCANYYSELLELALCAAVIYVSTAYGEDQAGYVTIVRAGYILFCIVIFKRIPTVFIRVSVGDWQLVQLVWKTITSLTTRALSSPASAASSAFSPVILSFCVHGEICHKD